MNRNGQAQSHPHPDSDLTAHCRAVAGHMEVLLSTSLAPAHLEAGRFLAQVTGLAHDMLKDTAAFQAHLAGKPSTPRSRHSGGSGVAGYLAAREILRQNPELLSGYFLRPFLPHMVFSVIAAHHGKLKQIDVDGQHGEAIEHWQKTRTNASRVLLEKILSSYGMDYDLKQMDEDLTQFKDDIFCLPAPTENLSGEAFFCAFLMCRLCLGAMARADAESAERQSAGISEPEFFEPEIHNARFSAPRFPKDATNRLNRLRTLFQDQVCGNWLPDDPVLLIKAPTGLGKTMAVCRLVEKIQKATGNSKVFYLAPTTAILNQVQGEIFKLNKTGDNMLLHYLAQKAADGNSSHNKDDDPSYDKDALEKRARRFQYLDAGLVATTYHRILSLLGGMSKNSCTALFNLKNAVLILDECQFLSHIQFGVFSLICSALSRMCNAVPVFMSATPPSPFLWQKAHDTLKWPAGPKLTSLLTDSQLDELENSEFVDGRRQIFPGPEIESRKQLVEQVRAFHEEQPQKSILVLVNLAKDAVAVGREINARFTITNFLRPIDVKRQLADAAARLNAKEPVVMAATSIVQAGVDLDFDAGFVELNDLRSFRQGCGRVGRNYISGRGACPVFAFDLKDNFGRSSWYRQRFGTNQGQNEDPVVKTYREIIQKGVERVLESSGPLTDCQVEAIEASFEKQVLGIFKTLQMRMLGFWGKYETLLGKAREQGFDFTQIEPFLTDDLTETESASPYLVVFTYRDADEYNEMLGMMGRLQVMGRNLFKSSPDYHTKKREYRELKKKIYRLMAPYSLRRMDIQQDFFKNFKGAQYCYDEFDCCLVSQPACYDPDCVGWILDETGPKESEGMIF